MRNKSKKTVGIINAIQAGESTGDIAKKFKVAKQVVYNIKYKMKDAPVKAKAKPRVEPSSVPQRSFAENKLHEAIIKNNDLFNEVKDQQAVIRYLEGLVFRIVSKQ